MRAARTPDKPHVLGAALGNCVHVAGVVNFLALARDCGYETTFLGPAQSPAQVAAAIERLQPDIVGVSYRLTPEAGRRLLLDLRDRIERLAVSRPRLAFGGTPPVCRAARDIGIFEAVFDGREEPEEVLAYLRGEPVEPDERDWPVTSLERLDRKRPYPLIRHHFGLPSVEATVEGVREIARASVLDVISLGPDQNAQESFFRPDEMNPELDGAGGVPVRTPEDLRRIYAAAQCGNRPLLRCYSGTRDLIKWAEMTLETMGQAWAAIPLCWYNVLDGRSNRLPEEAIRENHEAIRWYAQRGVPVEINEPHHWSLRDAHDALAVAMAYIAAYNARALGVRHYVAQYMFNTPPSSYGDMDLAKMLAKRELIEGLHEDDFVTLRQVRAGLAHFSPDPDVAKGQLAASTMLALQLRPHIVHVVGFCEADHAATAREVIESCRIVRGVIRNCLHGQADATDSARVMTRKQELIEEAKQIVAAVRRLGRDSDMDPLVDPRVLAEAIRCGLLDTPHFLPSAHARGALRTRMVEGACYAVDEAGRILSERERTQAALPGPCATARTTGSSGAD